MKEHRPHKPQLKRIIPNAELSSLPESTPPREYYGQNGVSIAHTNADRPKKIIRRMRRCLRRSRFI